MIKTVAPVALGALAPGLAPGMNPLLARALASGVGSVVMGGKPKDALLSAALGAGVGAMFPGQQAGAEQLTKSGVKLPVGSSGRVSFDQMAKKAVQDTVRGGAGAGTASAVAPVAADTMSAKLLEGLGVGSDNLLFKVLNTKLGEGVAAGVLAQLLSSDEEEGPAQGSFERRPFGAGGPGGKIGGIKYAEGGAVPSLRQLSRASAAMAEQLGQLTGTSNMLGNLGGGMTAGFGGLNNSLGGGPLAIGGTSTQGPVQRGPLTLGVADTNQGVNNVINAGIGGGLSFVNRIGNGLNSNFGDYFSNLAADVGAGGSPFNQAPAEQINTSNLSLGDMNTLGYMTPSYMPMDRGDGMDQFGRPMDSQLGSYTTGQIDQLRFNRPVTGGGFVGQPGISNTKFQDLFNRNVPTTHGDPKRPPVEKVRAIYNPPVVDNFPRFNDTRTFSNTTGPISPVVNRQVTPLDRTGPRRPVTPIAGIGSALGELAGRPFMPMRNFKDGGSTYFPRRNGGIDPAEGSGTKDDVPAMLMAGEFVMTRDAVKGMGDGNLRKGINRMYGMMDNLERMA